MIAETIVKVIEHYKYPVARCKRVEANMKLMNHVINCVCNVLTTRLQTTPYGNHEIRLGLATWNAYEYIKSSASEWQPIYRPSLQHAFPTLYLTRIYLVQSLHT
jgi:hypothetical protein